MPAERRRERLELLQGTLDLLILRTPTFGPQHGQGIARGRKAGFYSLSSAGRILDPARS